MSFLFILSAESGVYNRFCKQFLDGRANVITDVFYKRDGGNCALNDACCAAIVNNCRNEIEQRKYIAVYAKSKY